ncbi:hypothetical protein GGR57DRAFT_274132 [Xylariaceae sp. FL1272]|nr:hypothetical protein GGR57DRAFT_274132 [Xylariaceae sp. FL1272]
MSRRLDDDLAYGERWDKDRLFYERDRFEERERERDRYPPRAPVRERPREASVDERYFERRKPRPWEEEDDFVRERVYYNDEPRHRRSPPPELETRIVQRNREPEYRSPSPIRRPRPGMLRRQSSLDTFDRRPAARLYGERDRDRDEYVPRDRRTEYRPEPYQPIPLPRSRALPPPRVYAERDYDYDEIKISEPRRYGDDDFRGYPEHVREREIVRTKERRDRSGSRTSRARSARTHHSSSHHSASRSSSTSSSSSESGGTTVTSKSKTTEYPKKGKTRIPSRLVSIRAIMDLQYPFIEEGNTIIIQRALGQQNIDDLLKMSEEYKRVDAEISATRSIAPGIEERKEEFSIPPKAPTVIMAPPPPPPPPVEIMKETVTREISPARTARTARSHRSYSTSTTARTPYVVEAAPRQISDEVAVGPIALARDYGYGNQELVIRDDRHHHHHDTELVIRDDRHHDHHHHSHSRERDMVRAERLPTGELVLYEESIEKVEEPRRGVRIEKDKKGRMSISVPKYRK